MGVDGWIMNNDPWNELFVRTSRAVTVKYNVAVSYLFPLKIAILNVQYRHTSGTRH